MTAVITVYQPYASLIMAGVKTWETRGNPPHGDMRPEGVRGLPGKRINAGDRILIHAARTWAPGWLRWYNPDRSDTDLALTDALEEIGVEFGESDGYWYPNPMSLPLGAILGTVTVTQALQIYSTHWVPSGGDCIEIVDGEYLVDPDQPALVVLSDESEVRDLTDQLPYGHWLPGNWAWELADPIPITELCPVCEGKPCPECGGSGAVDAGTHDFGAEIVGCQFCLGEKCWACNDTGSCPPIPVKGKQGVWEWK